MRRRPWKFSRSLQLVPNADNFFCLDILEPSLELRLAKLTGNVTNVGLSQWHWIYASCFSQCHTFQLRSAVHGDLSVPRTFQNDEIRTTKLCCFWSDFTELTATDRSWPIVVTVSVLCALEDPFLQSLSNIIIAPQWQFRLEGLLYEHKCCYLLAYLLTGVLRSCICITTAGPRFITSLHSNREDRKATVHYKVDDIRARPSHRLQYQLTHRRILCSTCCLSLVYRRNATDISQRVAYDDQE